jgi:flagellar hook-length control protein FliK
MPFEFEVPGPVVSGPPATGQPGQDLAAAIKVAVGLAGVEARVPDSVIETAEPPPTTTAGGFDATLAATRSGVSSPTHLGETVRTVLVPVGERHWPDAVGHEVRLLVERGVSSATLRLSPEHLGPVEVRIEIVENQAKVWFGAAHADTRAALADALPRLRDMLEGSGVLLGDAGVHQDAPGKSRTHGLPSPSGSGESESVEPERATIARIGLIDAYA